MSGTPFQSGILIAPLINQTFSLFCQFKLDIFLLWMLPFVWLHSPPYFIFYFCSLSIHPLLVSLSNSHSIIYHITIICVCTLWPLHRCSLTSKSIVFWRSPDFDPLSISQISIMSSFIHCRQVTCGLKAAGLTLARALAGLQLAQDVSVGDGVNGVFFILRLTRSTVSWRALSWAKPVRKPSIFTMTTVSQVPPGRVCVVRYIWMLCLETHLRDVCIWVLC